MYTHTHTRAYMYTCIYLMTVELVANHRQSYVLMDFILLAEKDGERETREEKKKKEEIKICE